MLIRLRAALYTTASTGPNGSPDRGLLPPLDQHPLPMSHTLMAGWDQTHSHDHTHPLPPTDTPQWEHGAMAEQTYDDRIRAIEDQLGIPTSDAQATVDAEDLVAQRRK